MKSHYVYCAVGIRIFWRFFLPTFYIGVRTGVLPDNKYQTSSTTKLRGEWVYLGKTVLKEFPSRKEANKAEIELLSQLKDSGLWLALENLAITHDRLCLQGRRMPESTKKKISAANKGNPKISAALRKRHLEKSKRYWEYAHIYQRLWLRWGRPGSYVFSKRLGIARGKIRPLCDAFRDGWTPENDIELDLILDP